MTTNIFSYVNNINNGGPNMMRDTGNDELAEKDFVPWVANIAFALYPDTVLQANEMNQNPHLHPRAVYEYYKNSVRPKKRYAKWVKHIDDEDLIAVCNAYSCNRNIGKQYLSLLSRQEIDALKQKQETGGKK